MTERPIVIDETTDRYHLPLPSNGNTLAQDVPRLRAALRLIDAALKSVADGATDGLDAMADLLGGHISGATAHTPGQVGLGAVDNTRDADKPISTATALALAGKQATLVAGTNIKTLGGQSPLGAGDIPLVQRAMAMALTYTAGRVTTITEDGADTAITYNADGTVHTITSTVADKTRTETYNYSGGVLTGMTAAEI